LRIQRAANCFVVVAVVVAGRRRRDMAMADCAKVGGYAGFRGSRTVFPENHSMVPVSIKRWSLVQADKRAVFSSLVFRRVANDTSRDSDFKTLTGAFRLKAAPTTMWQLSEEDADSSDNFVQETEKELHVSTQLLQLDNSFDPYSAVSTPLYQTATFKQPSATDCGPYDYTRSGNPTRDVLERYGKPNLLSFRKLEVTAHFIMDTFSILYPAWRLCLYPSVCRSSDSALTM
jgi:hypothetical protein